jgi:hypothetical protein
MLALFPFHFAVNLDGELREVLQHLAHLVAALPAPHVDDDVRVGVLGQGLGDDGLAATEGPGDGRGSALGGGQNDNIKNFTEKARMVPVP